ncbi:MAG: hypothetical protein P4L22_06965 [Candidatus Babeliales bacterium]|nr:hypothetical protein [Candidatus Babeliales bacterium]
MRISKISPVLASLGVVVLVISFFAYIHCDDIITPLRDPFAPKKIKKNISLISVLSDDQKKIAVVEYDKESVLVSIGDTVGLKWQVISIEDKEIVLESLNTKKRKTVLLNYE